MNILSGDFIPHFEENSLEGVYFVSVYTAMHVTPFAHLLSTGYVIIGNVHSARVCYFSVYDDYLAVVSVENMIYPRETNRVELVYFNAFVAYVIQMAFAERTVV